MSHFIFNQPFHWFLFLHILFPLTCCNLDVQKMYNIAVYFLSFKQWCQARGMFCFSFAWKRLIQRWPGAYAALLLLFALLRFVYMIDERVWCEQNCVILLDTPESLDVCWCEYFQRNEMKHSITIYKWSSLPLCRMRLTIIDLPLFMIKPFQIYW